MLLKTRWSFERFEGIECDGEEVRRKKLTHELSNTECVVVIEGIVSS